MARKSRKIRTVCEHQQTVRIYKVAIYVRISVEDIRKKISDSIGTQKAMLLQFLQTQIDMELYETYEDVNFTGTNFDRPGFAKMIEDIQAGLVDCVIVKDLSRFGRNFEETGNFLERVFPFLGVRFISVGDAYDSLTAGIDESSLVVPLKNLMNEIYARDISKKIQSSIKMKQKRGEFCGSFAPYGYMKNGNSLTIDEETAPNVRLIFQYILEGYSDYMIAAKLNEQKIMPPFRYRFEKGITKAKSYEKARFWHKSAIKRISENPVYTGVLAQGKVRSTFLKGGKPEYTCREEWVVVENTHEAVIDKETFEAVKKIRDLRKKNHKPCVQVGNNIFRGLVFCSDCGAHMTRRKLSRVDGNDVYYFACNTYAQVDKYACTKKKIMESELNEILFASMQNQITLAVDVIRIIQKLQNNASYKQKHNILDNQIETLQKKLQQNHRFRGSLREDYKDGILLEQDYNDMKADYVNEKDNLQKELEILMAERRRSNTTLSTDNKWITAFNKFKAEKQLSLKMVSALIGSIYVSDNAKVDVRFNYRDEFQALSAPL